MRVTVQKKEATRAEILAAARKLFSDKGFEQTTTRDIAVEAGIATGTLFNYFPTKEALAMTLVAEVLEDVPSLLPARLRGDESLDEALFVHVALGLRRLAPQRTSVGRVIETAMSPYTHVAICEEAEKLRLSHIETVRRLILTHAPESGEPGLLTMHLYWTLYLGVLAYWAADESPHQQETLAFLDRTMRLFAASLTTRQSLSNSENSHGCEDCGTD